MLKSVLSQVFSYGITTILVRLFPFFLTFILTRLFSPEKYSLFVEFYAFAGIISVLLSHGMETAFFKFISDKNYNKNEVYSTTFLSIFFISILLLFFGFIFKDYLAAQIQPNNKFFSFFIICFLLILVFDALTIIPFAKIRDEEKILKFSILKIIPPILYFLIAIFLTVVLPYALKNKFLFTSLLQPFYNPEIGIGFVFIANLIASTITFVLLLKDIFSINFSFNIILWKKLFLYSFPIMIAGFGAIINETMDKIFLRYLLPKNIAEFQVGIYGACYKISTFMILFKQAYLLGIEPYFFKQAKQENSKKMYASLMNFFVIANCLILLGLITNISLIKNIMLAKQYWIGLDIVPIVLFGTLFLGIYLNLSIWYKLNSKTYYGAIITLVGTAITLFVNFKFIPIFGYWASAWATFLSYFVMMCVSFYLGQRKYPIPYNLKKILFHLFLTFLLAIFSFYYFNQNIYIGNLILLMYIATIFFCEKEEVLKIIQKEK